MNETTAIVDTLRLDLVPNASNRQLLAANLSGVVTSMLVAEGRRTLESRGEDLCDLSTQECLRGIGRLWAVEDEWLSFLSGSGQATSIRRVRRGVPLLEPSASLPIPVGYQPMARPTRFDVGGEAPMLLVPLPETGLRHVVELHQTVEGLSLTAFDIDEVLGASRGWLFAPGLEANHLRAFLLAR